MVRKVLSAFLFLMLLFATGCSLLSGGSRFLGDPLTSANGGYTISTVKDFSVKEAYGITQMVSPEGDTDKGPALVLIGTISDEDLDNTDLLKKFFNESNNMMFDKTKPFTVNGVKGILADISSVDYEYEMAGKVWLANPYPNQPFVLIGFSTAEEWKDFEPIVDAVLRSVELFEAEEISAEE